MKTNRKVSCLMLWILLWILYGMLFGCASRRLYSGLPAEKTVPRPLSLPNKVPPRVHR